MKNTAVLLVLLLCSFAAPLPAAAHGDAVPAVIDTDMAPDDVRAIALAIASEHVDVRGFVVSEGAARLDRGAANLVAVLDALCAPPVPVGLGAAVGAPAPRWRTLSESLGGLDVDALRADVGCPTGGRPAPTSADEALRAVFAGSEAPVLYVALGPLTNLARLLREAPELAGEISGVVYLGGPPEADAPGANTTYDPAAAAAVFAAGVPVYAVNLPAERFPTAGAQVQKLAEKGLAPAARLVYALQTALLSSPAADHVAEVAAWDDTLVLALDDPAIISYAAPVRDGQVRQASEIDVARAQAIYAELLGATPGAGSPAPPRRAVILDGYPSELKLLRDDVRAYAPDIIARHGLEEWKATLLTNELHRHLGIYSIVGAKMGLKARELLAASLDEVHVESEATLKPPLSCLNDGLQVATGASLGRGTIVVRVPTEEVPAAVAATFRHGDHKVRLRLKDEVLRRIRGDVGATVKRHGGTTPAYFEDIRRLALTYWRDLDRHTIFEIERD